MKADHLRATAYHEAGHAIVALWGQDREPKRAATPRTGLVGRPRHRASGRGARANWPVYAGIVGDQAEYAPLAN